MQIWKIGDKWYSTELRTDPSTKRQSNVIVETNLRDIRGLMGDKPSGFDFNKAIQEEMANMAREGLPQVSSLNDLVNIFVSKGAKFEDILPGGTPQQATEFANYLKETGQTYHYDTGFSGTPGQLNNVQQTATAPTTNAVMAPTSSGKMIRRDDKGNFYLIENGTERKLSEQEAFAGGLGINETFVPANSTVSLQRATTGQDSPTSSNTGVSGISPTAVIYRDQNDNITIDGKHVALRANKTANDYPIAWEDLGINVDFIPKGSSMQYGQLYAQSNPGQSGDGTSKGVTDPGDYKERWEEGVTKSALSIPTAVSDFDYSKYNITDELWNTLDPATKAFVESMSGMLQAQYDQGVANVSINADLYNKAYEAAKNDPNIMAKYGDALKLDQGSLVQNLGLIDAEFDQKYGLNQMRFEQEKKQLADMEADAGRAFSGFRKQAEGRLATEQSGVIESSKRQLQGQLNQMGQALEARYGTQGLSQFGNLSAGGLAYNPIGNITGTVERDKEQDILTKAANTFNMERLPT